MTNLKTARGVVGFAGVALAFAAVGGMVSGCTSTPPPSDTLTSEQQQAIQDAQNGTLKPSEIDVLKQISSYSRSLLYPVNQVTDANFDQEVLKSDKPVVVEFYATRCGHCKAAEHVMNDAAKHKSAVVKIVKLDVVASPQQSDKYYINGTPTLIMFRKGDVIGRMIGVGSEDALNDWIANTLAQPAGYRMDLAPRKLTDSEQQRLRSVFEEAVKKNPDADKPYTIDGTTTTLRKSVEDGLKDGSIAKQVEEIMAGNEISLDQAISGIQKNGLHIPPGAKM